MTTKPDQIAATLDEARETGITTNEVIATYGWTYPVASSTLSRMHRQGRITRLAETRDGQKVYVAPEWVNDRETEEHGRATGTSRALTTRGDAPQATVVGIAPDAMNVLVGSIAQAFQAAVQQATGHHPVEGVLEVDPDEYAALQDRLHRLQADYELAQARVEELESAEPDVPWDTVADAIEAAAANAWNAQAKVALLDVAEKFRGQGE